MDAINVNDVLARMRSLQAMAEGKPSVTVNETQNSFAETFKTTMSQVNDLQMQTSHLQEAYERGDSDVSLAKVMVASQKSSVAFQGVVQVRNKLIESYKDIMNMPI